MDVHVRSLSTPADRCVVLRDGRWGSWLRCLIDPRLDADAALALVRSAVSGARPRRGRRRRTIERLEFGSVSAVLKVERLPFPNWLVAGWGRSSSRRDFERTRLAAALGARVFRALLCGERRWGPFCLASCVLTREEEGGVNLSQWLRDPSIKARRDLPEATLRAALPSLLAQLAALHRQRFYCGTLFGKNVLARQNDGGSGLELILHDLPRAVYRPGRGLDLRRAAWDLACLDRWGGVWLARTERLRLLRGYLAALGNVAPPLAQWLRQLEAFRRRLRRETFFSWLSHWTRRRAKQVPLLGSWVR